MKKTLFSNSLALSKFLKKIYGDRLNTDSFAALVGIIDGTLDLKKINIIYNGGKSLIVSAKTNSKDVLDQLLPILTCIMGNVEPICSYDLKRTKNEDTISTIEWDIVNPEKRIREIVNDMMFYGEMELCNLRLYDDKNVDDYLDNNEEQNQRIYGLDPGCIKDVSIINNLSEINLYFMINAMEQYIRKCKYDMFLDRIPKIDLTEEQYALEYMVYQTTKYGVELDDPTVNKHIIPTDSYRLWFDFYSNYFKNIFTNESFNSFWQIQNNGLGSSMFELEKKLQKVKK